MFLVARDDARSSRTYATNQRQQYELGTATSSNFSRLDNRGLGLENTIADMNPPPRIIGEPPRVVGQVQYKDAIADGASGSIGSGAPSEFGGFTSSGDVVKMLFEGMKEPVRVLHKATGHEGPTDMSSQALRQQAEPNDHSKSVHILLKCLSQPE